MYDLVFFFFLFCTALCIAHWTNTFLWSYCMLSDTIQSDQCKEKSLNCTLFAPMTTSSKYIAFFERHYTHLDTQQRGLASIRGKSLTYTPPTLEFCTAELVGLLLQYPGGVTEAVARTHLCTRFVEQAR